MAAHPQGVVTIHLNAAAGTAAEGDVQVTQISRKGVDGGVTLRVAKKGSPMPTKKTY